jgi:preprotein translocase subunit SecD
MINFPKWKVFLALGICVWAIYTALPNFIPEQQRAKYKFLSDKTIKLGLDLQGGSHLLLRVDFKHYLKEHFDSVLDDIRKNFRKEKIGYINLGIKQDSNNNPYISFTLRDAGSESSAKDKLKSISRDFSIETGADNSFRVSYSDDVLKAMQKDVIEKSIEIVRRRVDETGTREPIIQMQGKDRIILQVPGLQDPSALKKLLGKVAKMNFHLMNEDDPYAQTTKFAGSDEVLLADMKADSPQQYLVKKTPVISGDMLVDARTSFDQAQPVVSFRFNNLGGKKFAQITSENVGKPFAVVLDGKVITAPRINTAILGGSGIITGNFTTPEANELSLLLRSGALPAPLTIVEERTVGPSLGQDSIEKGKLATIAGVIMISALMIVMYRLFGVIANLALVMHMIIIIAILSLFGATLTMPGIAGLVLTMGMGVDANVLIFERIKEEYKLGKSIISAIDSGFNQAYRTILDSNLTTLIAAFLLFSYGAGTVKGFAVTLTVGILSSVFAAVTLTKLMIIIWLKQTKPKILKL